MNVDLVYFIKIGIQQTNRAFTLINSYETHALIKKDKL